MRSGFPKVVLGDTRTVTTLPANTDLNNILNEGFYIITQANVSNTLNTPTGVAGRMVVSMTLSGLTKQEYWAGTSVYTRIHGNSWGDWGNSDAFGNTSISSLASALGVRTAPFLGKFYPSTVSSMDDVIEPGFYIADNWTNKPSIGEGAVLVFCRNANIYQVWFGSNSDALFFRRRNSNTTWNQWHQIAFSES